MPNTLGDFLGIVGVIISVASAVFSFYFSRQALKSTTKQLSVDIKNFQLEYFRDLRLWAQEVVEVISEAQYLCELDLSKWSNDEFLRRQNYLRYRLSALADKGRWFLPNTEADKVGTEKEVAFQGFRQRYLSAILRIHKLVLKIDSQNCVSNNHIQEEIVKERRSFVSEIQVILDPRIREQELKEIITDRN